MAKGPTLPKTAFNFDPVLDSPLLGAGLPAEAARYLDRAADCYRFTDVAETNLFEAERIAPDHPAVLIGLYRFYFYKGKLTQCLGIAARCIARALRENLLPGDWRQVRASDADFSDWGAIDVRFLLFSLKGYAYLNMRLGRLEEGREALEKLLELDPLDRIGARVLLNVLDLADEAEDE